MKRILLGICRDLCILLQGPPLTHQLLIWAAFGARKREPQPHAFTLKIPEFSRITDTDTILIEFVLLSPPGAHPQWIFLSNSVSWIERTAKNGPGCVLVLAGDPRLSPFKHNFKQIAVAVFTLAADYQLATSPTQTPQRIQQMESLRYESITMLGNLGIIRGFRFFGSFRASGD